MTNDILGLHHVSTISGAPARNVAFYTRLLGLRLVKKTVNFDAPRAYHLYYGDRIGRPGTLITFFPHAAIRPGVRGTGEVDVTHFAVPSGSLAYWKDRLNAAHVGANHETIGGRDALTFRDADNTRLSLIETAGVHEVDRPTSDVPPEHAIIGLAAVTTVVKALDPTAVFVTETLGFKAVGQDGNRAWFVPSSGDGSPSLEVVIEPTANRAQLGLGSVHHVAWRVKDAAAQLRVRDAMAGKVAGLTDVRDRNYFQSIYFREPGGVIFEIATDGPGFAVDEDEASLGTALKLPAQFEPQRSQIEAVLPPLENES